MSIIKWSPFLMPSLADEMDKMFESGLQSIAGGSSGFTPAIDVYETKDAVVAETPLAGIDPKDVEVTVQNGVLTVKGESKKESEVDEKNYYRKEVRSGSFYRQVALPTKVQEDGASAEFENGMLKIIIPKAAEIKARTIKVEMKNK
ncbi:MAG: Hsp20/alpha crystallin family protein [Candidatus Magasanikbacteria bacterium]|nr:Hsp20/alpha crystallin family protein [Candidatus Magasanikbacteria bacterium]